MSGETKQTDQILNISAKNTGVGEDVCFNPDEPNGGLPPCVVQNPLPDPGSAHPQSPGSTNPQSSQADDAAPGTPCGNPDVTIPGQDSPSNVDSSVGSSDLIPQEAGSKPPASHHEGRWNKRVTPRGSISKDPLVAEKQEDLMTNIHYTDHRGPNES